MIFSSKLSSEINRPFCDEVFALENPNKYLRNDLQCYTYFSLERCFSLEHLEFLIYNFFPLKSSFELLERYLKIFFFFFGVRS